MNGAAAKTAIRDQALTVGFDTVGFAGPDLGESTAQNLRDYVAQGYHGHMDWFERRAEARSSPRELWPEVGSVVVLGLNYGPAEDPLEALSRPRQGTVSVYARNRDYHDVVKKRLKRLGRWMVERFDCQIKVFVDTAPVMEKPLAERAGVGWQGKHTNLISRGYGSWLFLGEIYTTLELPADGAETDHCGTCHKCLDICPTNAFPGPYRLDARRCISYLTIELKGSMPLELRPLIGNRIFGCDDCQLICPWNRFAQHTDEVDFTPRHQLDDISLVELLSWDEATFLKRTEGSAIRRTGYEGWLRNIAVALGNSKGGKEVVDALNKLLSYPSEVVQEHAHWALNQLASRTETLPLLILEHSRGKKLSD